MMKADFVEAALYRSIKLDNFDMLRVLLSQGEASDIHFFQYCGDTPIGLAVSEGKEHLLPLLLAKTDKCFALHAAVQLKQVAVLKYLREHCHYRERFLHFLGLK